MGASRIVELAIGLSFVYLLLSLMCSALNEMAAAVTALRQYTLRRGIRAMLADSKELRDAVYRHPLTKSISYGMFPWTRLPSYMRHDIFSAVLNDVLASPKESLKTSEDALKLVKRAIAGLMAGTRIGDKLDQ